MKKRWGLSLTAVLLIALLALAGCGSSGTTNSGDTGKQAKAVKITLLNSKGEIQAQLEAAAAEFSKENPGITLDVIPAAAGQSPFQKISSMYAAGNAPTMAMLDPGDIPRFQDKFADLSGEKWVKDATDGSLNNVQTGDGKVMAFPFTVEGYGLIYNKAVLDKAFGGNFDPASIRTRDDLANAFKKVEASGVKPLIITPMDWSLGAHFLPIAYADQAKDPAAVNQFIQDLKAGKVNLINNAVFNGLIDTFDLMKTNNSAKADPMSVTYDKGPEILGKGQAGFWFMGNWASPQIKTFDTANGAYGFVPIPISNNPGDYGNAGIPVGVTKYIGIDKVQNSPEQQAAAKKFLDWLVYSPAGQDTLVNKCSIIPAFKNITLVPGDPLAKSILDYRHNHNTLEFMTVMPPDHWSQLGAFMQKYLAGKSSRAELFHNIENYWKNAK